MTQPNNAPQPAPLFNIQANSPRELMLKVAQIILQKGREMGLPFVIQENKGENKRTGNKAKYAVWNLDDSGKVSFYNDGITLTPEESKALPTTDGCPVVMSASLVLRQLTPVAVLASRITERVAATAERDAKNASRASDDALLAELNKRRIAAGQKPIEG